VLSEAIESEETLATGNAITALGDET